MDRYFMLHASADGIHFKAATKDEVAEAAEDGDVFFAPNDKIDADPNYWGDKTLLIKGKIVQPKPVETVTKFEVE